MAPLTEASGYQQLGWAVAHLPPYEPDVPEEEEPHSDEDGTD